MPGAADDYSGYGKKAQEGLADGAELVSEMAAKAGIEYTKGKVVEVALGVTLGVLASDAIVVRKAVNTNLVHAIERGVERGVFGSSDEARAALRGLSEQISASGAFPVGTLVDTARADSFLVPVGDNGLAVYRLARNGTAKLKTVLIAR